MKKISEIIFENRKECYCQFAQIYVINNNKKTLISFFKNLKTLQKGIEVYQGKNYIVGSNDKSYSRYYEINNIPPKYLDIVNELINSFKLKFENGNL